MFLKVCGITREEDGVAAAELGFDAIGFVFYEKSKRFVNAEKARKVAEAIGKRTMKIGVFVDAEEKKILKVAELVGLNGVQLHGSEAPEKYTRLIETSLMIIKAVFPEEANSIEVAYRWLAVTPYILLDKFHPEMPGGTGMAFDWSLIKNFASMKAKIIIAGGVTPNNITKVLSVTDIWGVDVSSGVEVAPGIKSREKMQELIKKVKNCEY